MLEQPVLLLQPWADDAARHPANALRALRRLVADPEDGRPLGFACPRPVAGGWLARWLSRPVLEVHES